ncbi:MAG: hypothetical protein ACR2GR_07970 [Rhodothermales bacterium]
MKRFAFAPLLFLLLAACWVGRPASAQAQDQDLRLNPRFGLGINTMLSGQGAGLGLRGRVSAPLNTDLSLALDLGVTGFFLRGRDDASYVFDPQASAIVNVPFVSSRFNYLIVGVGGFVVFEADGDTSGGPTIHFGLGKATVLNETTLFYEINPAVIIGEQRLGFALPLRIGIIF